MGDVYVWSMDVLIGLIVLIWLMINKEGKRRLVFDGGL